MESAQCNRFSLSTQREIQILFQRYDSGEPSGLCRGVFLLIKNIDGSLGFENYDQLSAMQIICYRLVPFCIVLFNCVKIKSKLTMLNEKFIRSYQYNCRLFAFKFFFVYIVFTIQTLPIKIHLGHNNPLMFVQIPFFVLSQSETRTHYIIKADVRPSSNVYLYTSTDKCPFINDIVRRVIQTLSLFSRIQFIFTMFNSLKCSQVKLNFSNLCIRFST